MVIIRYAKILLLLGLVELSGIIGCIDNFKVEDDELTLTKQPYQGNSLRVDGYFHRSTASGNLQVYFLYRNGILLHGGDFDPEKLATKEEMYRNGEYFNLVDEYRTSWGLFQIDSNMIKFETWYPGDASWQTFIRSGEILNDTTFHISQSYRSNGTEYRTKDETYNFKAFTPKPDSIVSFNP